MSELSERLMNAGTWRGLLLPLRRARMAALAAFSRARFRSYTLWTKMLMAFLLVALVPALVLAYVNDRATQSALLMDAERELSAAAQQTATQIDVFIDTNLDALRTESQLPDFAQFLSLPPERQDGDVRAHVTDDLRAFTRQSPDIRSIALLDTNGQNLADTDVRGQGGDESAKDYFQTPFRERLPYASPIHIDQATGNAAIYFSSLIHNPSGQFIGMLRVRYSANTLQQIILRNNGILGAGSFAMLVDENHVILAHGNAPELILQPVAPLTPARALELQKQDRLLASSKEPPPNLIALDQGLSHPDTQPFFAAVTDPRESGPDQQAQVALVRLEAQPWLIAFSEPQTVFLSPLTEQTRSEVFLGIFLLLGVAAAAVWFAKQLASPIVNLTAVAHSVAAGDLTPRVSVETSDEIGQLAAAFQTMVGAVETRESELKVQAAETVRLFQEEQMRRSELSALYDLSRRLAASTDLDEILNFVVREAVKTVHVTFARVALVQGDELLFRVAHPVRVLDHELEVGTTESIKALPHCQQFLAQDTPTIIRSNDSALTPHERATLFLGVAQTVCLVPLHTDHHTSGLLMLGEARDEARELFNADKIRLARSIGDQAASALRRTELFAELESTYLQTVLALANAVEAKDTYTGDHAKRLADWGQQVGREFGMSASELEDLRYGAILHDIGKIGVPDAILQKPGPLEADEWARMRQHPVIGAKILGPIPRLAGAAEIVRYHHERYDGKGYPDDLAGEAIPLGARILAVVDAYCAIVDKRVYKEARPREEAVAELKRCAGTQFDPAIVQVFLRILSEDHDGTKQG